jgi:hypothetical protein
MFFPGHVRPFDTNIPDLLFFQVARRVIVSFNIFETAGMLNEQLRLPLRVE